MSEFRRQIEKAARRQRLFMLGFVIFCCGVLLVVAGGVLMTRATPVQILPPEAAEAADVSATRGLAIYFQGALFSLTRYPKIEARAPGFEPLERVIEPAEEGSEVRLTLRPLPAELNITATNIKEEINWFIDGMPVSSAPSLAAELEAGSYVIRAEHPWYTPLEKRYDLVRGEKLADELTLERVKGLIRLDVTPKDAAVLFNGAPISDLPTEIEVAGGRYEVLIEKEGYAPIEDVIEVSYRESEVTRNYRLQTNPAFLRIDASPAGGRLTLNGKSISAGKKQQLAAGQTYHLRYAKDGYGFQEQEVTLKPGEERAVSFNLALKIGEVHITSAPPATVMIDGKPAGETPLKVRLPAMAHEFVVSRAGYRSVKQTLTVEGDTVRRLDILLQTEQAAMLSAAKPVYSNSLGMEMRLFEPTGFTMGAPRSEKGQRANEFERKVEMSRHFYVSAREVTEAEFSQFQNKRQKGDSYPVTNVSWDEAARFCNWLSEKEGLAPFYRFDARGYRGFDAQSTGYRLLSEAEWEWLARKANRSRQTIFPWGDETVIPKGTGNIADESAKGKARFYVPGYLDGYADVAPVASFARDKIGLYDLFGNVSEWVHDYYSLIPPPAGQVLRDPLGEQTGDNHLYKGASFASGTLSEIRPAYRGSGSAGSDMIGFRVARYLYGEAK